MPEFPGHCVKVKNSSAFFMYSFQRSALLSSGRRACKDHCPSFVLSHLLSSAVIYWTCLMSNSSPACLVLNALMPIWEETSTIWHVPLPSCFHSITEKLRLEGTAWHYLSLFWKWVLRFSYPGPCQAKYGVFPVKEIPSLLWATISNAELFLPWIFFFLCLDDISSVVTCAHCLLPCCCASLWRHFSVALSISLKLPFGF